jgi:glycosyltransferase involved in cell wall biosynthesis
VNAHRITFIAGTLGRGGAERQLCHQVKACLDLGLDVEVLCLTEGEHFEARLAELGAKVRHLGGIPSRMIRALRITRAVRRHESDIVQSAHFYTNLYAVFAARLSKAREIGAVRSDATTEVAANGYLGGPSLRRPRLLAANSRQGLANAIALGRSRASTHYLPNAVDLEHFAPPASPPKGPFTVLGLGRLDARKRFEDFLRIIAGVNNAATPVRARIHGTGPLHDGLQSLAEELGLAGALLGPVDDPASAYRSAHALLVTSEREGTSNVVLEAMACGLPVIASRVGDLPHLIEHEVSGLLFDVGDLATARRHTAALARDPERRAAMGRSARDHVASHHGPRRLREALTALYDEA